MPKNILMVLADQHQARMMGCAGHPQVRTPNLDRFAASGVRFDNAYSQNTICTPSRVSILSGQYCHNHGIYGLSGPAPSGLPNLMRHCKAAGYRTAGFGKLHLPNAPRNWLADDLDLFGDTYETVDGEHGRSAFLDDLEERGLRELEDSWHNEWNYGRGTISLDARPSMLPYEHTQEVWCARQAMGFMDASAQANAPFCVQIAFQKPHHPLLPNERFWDLYPPDLELPDSFAVEPGHRPPPFQQAWRSLREMEWDFGQTGETFRDGARRVWRGTLACVSQIDDVLGMLLHYLQDRGLQQDTIVIYGGDHGGYHTLHGLPEKAPGICSDAVCRVPMIWHVPGLTPEGLVCDALVENTDISPTLLSLCGLPPMETADGLDITPLLAGEDAAVHPVAVTENPWSKAIRWGPWRLVHYQPETFPGADFGELYNIQEDPQERSNLYAHPAYRDTVTEGRRLLLEWLIRTTRIVTNHPATKTRLTGTGIRGTFSYPLAGDGRAPTSIQPAHQEDVVTYYI